MLAYYGSRISENMTRTPEGFLICRNVPIARLGVQKYLPDEIGMTGDSLVTVHRTADEVFSTAAMASFEGKPVTLEHPPVTVTPDNAGVYQKGHAQNVHKGTGEEADLLIADLFITDSDLIRQIEDGLREVSCGYECEYLTRDGRVHQSKIRGNHVAVVAAGRAGNRVSIKDSVPEPITKGAKKKMAKKPSVFSRMVAHWAQDAEPEEVASVIDEMLEDPTETVTEESTDAEPMMPVAQEEPMATDEDEVVTLLKKILAKVSGEPDPTADPIDMLTDEIAGGDPNAMPVISEEDEEAAIPAVAEPKVSVPAEQLGDSDLPNYAEGTETTEEIIGGTVSADSAAAIAMIQAAKPFINRLNAKDRKACTDSMTRAYRKAMGRSEVPARNGYAEIMNVKKANAKRVSDAKPVDESDLGRVIMSRKNPHYKA